MRKQPTPIQEFEVGERIEWEPTNCFVKSGEIIEKIPRQGGSWFYVVAYKQDGEQGIVTIEADETTRRVE